MPGRPLTPAPEPVPLPARGRRLLASSRLLFPGALLLIAASSAPPARALLGEELPHDHWANEIVEELRLRGVPVVASAGMRPYSVAEIVDSLAVLEGRENDEPAASLLALLRAEFGAEVASRATPETHAWAGAVWLEPEYQNLPGDRSAAKGIARGEFAAARGERFSAYLRAEVDSDGARDPDFLGRTWKRGITGMVDYATLQWRGEGWRIVAGRRRPAWGPDGENGLLLSGHAPSIDGAAAMLDWGPFAFRFTAAQLDEIDVRRSELADSTWAHLFDPGGRARPVPRFLSAHRVEWQPLSSLTLGASELVLYGGPERTLEFAYLIPIVPLYNEQWNRGGNDNIFVSLDAEWFPAAGQRLWGELLLDDAQYKTDNEPQETGFALGWEGTVGVLRRTPLLRVEYTRVNAYVYGHSIPWNRATIGRSPLGDPLGSDADRIRTGAVFDAGAGKRLRLEGSWTRRGEITPETPRPGTVPFPEEFPSGVVEKTLSARVGFEWIAPPWARVLLWAGGERIDGRGHRAGDSEDRWLGGIALRVGARTRSP